MKIRSILISAVIAICATAVLGQTGGSNHGEIQEIINQIESGKIGRVIIFQATDIQTNRRMAPITLTYAYTQKLDYEIRTQAQRDALILLLKNLKVSSGTNGANVRVGIVFAGTQPIDTRQEWKYGIFSDEFGKDGYMDRIGSQWQLDGRDDRAVQINRELWNFASRLFATVDH